MAAYLIADIEVEDPERYQEYVRQAGPAARAYGGEFIARGGATEVLEGDWKPGRVVVVRFESMARAREWWNSEEYAGPKEIRRSASTGRMILVEGA
jgi:uncharacterized protein (DUF1330 family)